MGADNKVKGYKIQQEGKRVKTSEENNIPAVDDDDPCFSALQLLP